MQVTVLRNQDNHSSFEPVKNFKVDIIIPTYNCAGTVSEAINSIQTNNWEETNIIIVDDGSTDDTETIIKGFSSDTRIQYTRQTNSGPAAARNNGISISKNDYIAFLDADDVWLPNRLEKTLTLLTTGNFDWVATSFLKQFPDGHREYRTFPDNCSLWDKKTGDVQLIKKGLYFFSALPIWTGTLLFKRKVLEKLGGFDETLYVGEDWDLYMRAAKDGFRLGYLDEPTAVYNYCPGSLTKANKIDGIREHLRIARKYGLESINSDQLIKSSYSQFVWEAGRAYLARRNLTKSFFCFTHSLIIDFSFTRIKSLAGKIKRMIEPDISR